MTPIEKDKLQIDPDFDFRDIAQRPFHDVKTNEIGMFKWTGVYHQLQKGFFMIRLRLPGGLIQADQLERAVQLAEQYGQGQLCITTRQTLQFHWIRQEDIYKVLEEMENVGVSSKNACGDVTRNVVTCSLQGVCPHELADTRKMLTAIADDSELLDEQRNLPRKHKISVSGCGRACGQTLMNCQGWYPVKRFQEEGDEEIGWKYHAGGGLGARPYMAKVIFDWVPEELVCDVTRAATEIFRQKGNRRIRAYARMKVVVDKLGAHGFGEAILAQLHQWQIQGLEKIEAASHSEPDVGDMFLDGQTLIPQRQQGYSVVRIMILRSEFHVEDGHRFVRWARTYGNGEIMLTNRQNLELRYVKDSNVQSLLEEIREAGYPTEGHEHLPDMVACVGTTQCNLAVSDTPNTYRALYAELASDKALWEEVGSLRIHMNGCPNSCAQHWIADIGLRGMREQEEEGSSEGFGIFIGGKLSGGGHIAEHLCDVSSEQMVSVIRQLLEFYVENRKNKKQKFGDFVREIGAKSLIQKLGPISGKKEPLNRKNLKLQPAFHAALIESSVHEK